MEIKYNATGARRKELVKALAVVTNEKPVYLGTPSFGYKVGDIEVTRDGTLRLPLDGSFTDDGSKLTMTNAQRNIDKLYEFLYGDTEK